jgi:activator of HSP90 ATPase
MKIFEFSRNGKTYTVKSESKSSASKYLLDEYGVDIKNCIEIPESEWDNKKIEVFEDNNTENEPFHISLRDACLGDGTELLGTNDWSLID